METLGNRWLPPDRLTKQVKRAVGDAKLNGLLQRINDLTGGGDAAGDASLAGSEVGEARDAEFIPREPQSLQEVGLSESEVESLILKLMLSRGDLVGRDIADHIRLPFVLVDEILRQMKQDQLVVYRSSAAMNDYLYQLTDLGRERARRQAEHCSYFGAAPVTLAAYIEAVKAQSLETSASDRRRPATCLRRPADQSHRCSHGWGRRSIRAAGCFCSGLRATARRVSRNA